MSEWQRYIPYVLYNGCNLLEGLKYDEGFVKSTCRCSSGSCGPSCGGAVGGDPHFRTHDGTLYSFHGECDLVMARSKSFADGLGLDIHARTTMIDGTWSLVSNAAIRIGNDVLEVANDGKHYVNGASDISLPTLLSNQYDIHYSEESVDDGDNSTRRWYTIGLGKEEKVVITNYKNMISINVGANLVDSEGMLGNSRVNGMVGRDGVSTISDPNEMGLHWQVNAEEPMLFRDLRAPQFPETCTLPNLAKTHRRLRSNSNKLAEEACSGIEGELYDFCYHDVMISGDASLAMTYHGGVF